MSRQYQDPQPMVRSYDMRKRDLAAEATRDAIIDAAHGLLSRPDGGSLTVQEVADAAGVSRATVYSRVGSRRDLLTAVFVDQGRLIRFDRVLDAMELDDPMEGVLSTVRESCRAWAVMPDAIRRTLALAVLDPEVGGLVHQFERHRRERLRGLAKRALKAHGVTALSEVREASCRLALMTSFSAFDHIRVEHSVDRTARYLVAMTQRLFGITMHREGANGR